MKSVLPILLPLLMAGLLGAAEKETARHKYDFSITDSEGKVLGKGAIALPFAFGAIGKGTATWQFTANEVVSTNKYWLKAKAQLAKGTGNAKAVCEDSLLRLDFTPGWADRNVTVSWALKKKELGTVSYDDFAGSHCFAFFKISQSETQP